MLNKLWVKRIACLDSLRPLPFKPIAGGRGCARRDALVFAITWSGVWGLVAGRNLFRLSVSARRVRCLILACWYRESCSFVAHLGDGHVPLLKRASVTQNRVLFGGIQDIDV